MTIPSDLNQSQSAAIGAVMGALIGDAAGAVLEFWGDKPSSRDVENALMMRGGGALGVAPGQITDDGELAIALAETLASESGEYHSESVARAYIDWAESEPFDIGHATHSALRHGLRGAALSTICQREARAINSESKANGALMRITPLAVATAYCSHEETIALAYQDAELTHPNIACQQANASYVLAIRHLIMQPGDATGAIHAAQRYLEPFHSEVGAWLNDALCGDIPDATKMIGFVRHGFTRAFHHLVRGSKLRDALFHTLQAGGDTDTNACIVGGLIGAYWGINEIASNSSSSLMLDAVMNCDPSIGQPRPARYHAKKMIDHVSAFTIYR
jgi:ADP-ribosyl-[dinitrogen reductase] hydrolase